MKKFIVSILILICMLALFGCKKVDTSKQANASVASSVKTSSSIKSYGLNESAIVKGISVEVTNCKLMPVVGDRTSDNVAQKNGDYFALGSDIKKVSDYQSIDMTFKIVNNSTQAYTFSQMGLKAKLQDNTDLSTTINLNNDTDVQVSSNNSGNLTISYDVLKTVSVKSIKLTYAFLNYNSDWSDDIGKVMSSSMTETAYNAKYKPVNLNFEIAIKQ